MIIEPRIVKLTTRTEVDVRRTIPHAKLRRIGAWVFVDHFGPTEQVDGMTVAAHPHTGLQTVTWLLDGLIDHRDIRQTRCSGVHWRMGFGGVARDRL